MSPEIRIGKNVVAKVPDETGVHAMLDGTPVYVNVDAIEASNRKQQVIVETEALGGRRTVGLTQEGIGHSNDPKRGDGKQPEITVLLENRPIRISYTDRLWIQHSRRSLADVNVRGGYIKMSKRTYKNPRWVKGHGQR